MFLPPPSPGGCVLYSTNMYVCVQQNVIYISNSQLVHTFIVFASCQIEATPISLKTIWQAHSAIYPVLFTQISTNYLESIHPFQQQKIESLLH